MTGQKRLHRSKSNAQFTVVTGRRRIGKTHLVWKAYEDEPMLYFFVARKAENFDADALSQKVAAFARATGQFKDYAVTQKGLSMTDM